MIALLVIGMGAFGLTMLLVGIAIGERLGPPPPPVRYRGERPRSHVRRVGDDQ